MKCNKHKVCALACTTVATDKSDGILSIYKKKKIAKTNIRYELTKTVQLYLTFTVDFQNKLNTHFHFLLLYSVILTYKARQKHTHSPRQWFVAVWGRAPPRWVLSHFGQVSPAGCSWPSDHGTASSGTHHHDNLDGKQDGQWKLGEERRRGKEGNKG